MEKICVDCIFSEYCYDSEFGRYADCINQDGTCDHFQNLAEYSKRRPCELNDYCLYDRKLYKVWCLSYHKDISVDEFRVNLCNVIDNDDMVEVSASMVVFLTREEAEKKLEELK